MPRIVVWLLVAFVAVHVVRELLPDYQNGGWSTGVLGLLADVPSLAGWVAMLPDVRWFNALLAFIPARFAGLDVADALPGGTPAIFSQFVTHVFVHGDLTHLGFNSAWLLAFATPIARRIDTVRFLTFFFLAGCAGALFFTAVNGLKLTLLVGASGAISGLMGASFRFIFGEGALHIGSGARAAPLMSLGETLRNRRLMTAVAGWTVLNILVAWGAAATLTDAAGIAWEAHLGGFAAGLLLYGWFESAHPAQPDDEDDAATAI